MTQELPRHSKAGRSDDNSRIAADGSGESQDSSGPTHRPAADASAGGKSNPFGNRLPKVVGPDGTTISIADLPPADTKRWVIRRKAEVVAAVRGGLISLDEACQRYTLSVEEFLSWQRAIESFGLSGLRTTRLQRYRTGNRTEDA